MSTTKLFSTEQKRNENLKNKKNQILKVKQSLFQQLTSQSSHKLKSYINEDSTFRQFKIRNCNEENSKLNSYMKENTKPKMDISFEKVSETERKKIIRNSSDLIAYRAQTNNRLSLSKTNNNITSSNIKSMRSFTLQKRNLNHYSMNKQLISYLPFYYCKYHKYNIFLPKKYTCNYKRCSCCEYPPHKSMFLYENNSINEYPIDEKSSDDKDDYIYSSKHNKKDNKNKNKSNNKNKINSNKDNIRNNNKSKNMSSNNSNKKSNKSEHGGKKVQYRNVLAKFEKNNKTKISDYDSNELSHLNFNCNFTKPINSNLKIPKKQYMFESESEKNMDEINFVELPKDFNMIDENELKNYKNLANQTNKKSNVHFSIMYYKRMNKSYHQVYSKDVMKQQKKKNPDIHNKQKYIEYLRE